MVQEAHDQVVWSFAYHPLGHVLASTSRDCSVRFWCRARPPGGQEIDRWHVGDATSQSLGVAKYQQADEEEQGMSPRLGVAQELIVNGLQMKICHCPVYRHRLLHSHHSRQHLPRTHSHYPGFLYQCLRRHYHRLAHRMDQCRHRDSSLQGLQVVDSEGVRLCRVSKICSIRSVLLRRRVGGDVVDGDSSSTCMMMVYRHVIIIIIQRVTFSIPFISMSFLTATTVPGDPLVTGGGAGTKTSAFIAEKNATLLTISTRTGVRPGMFCSIGSSITTAAPLRLSFTGFAGGGRFSFGGVTSCDPRRSRYV